jgi:uncharacterized protein
LSVIGQCPVADTCHSDRIIKPQPQWQPPVAISPNSGPLQGAVFLGQRWRDLTFLHWRVAEATVAPLLPVGTRPDVYDGTSWVGLIPFRLSEARFGHGPPLPYVGSFAELNVRLYSVDAAGRRGVVFRSLEASRLAFVLGARWALGLNYTWARMQVEERDGVVSYRSRRRWPAPKGAASRVVVRIGSPAVSDMPLATFLTARWGLHTHHRGRLLYLPNTHEPWPLLNADLIELEDDLVEVAGLPGVTSRPPDSVLFSRGVRTDFGRPERSPRTVCPE